MDVGWMSVTGFAAYATVLAILCVYGLHRYTLVYLFGRVKRRHPQPAARYQALPHVTIQLPMYNERFVAQRVIEAACAVDYPRDRLEIQVLDDSTDETCGIAQACVERMRRQGHNVVYLHRDDRTGFKAGALEHGLRKAQGEFVAIFDADFIPPRDILHDTLHYFTDPRIGMVQTRWGHTNRASSLLTQTQAILLDGHFLIEHTARNRSGRFMSFNGTAGVWRRSTIEDAGGWEHDTLTEDLDLSYRAQLRGWRFVFLPGVVSPAELPPEMNAFKAQQHRWTKGGAQTCVKLLPRVLRSNESWKVKLEAFFHLTSGAVYVLIVLLTLLIGPALFFNLGWGGQRTIWHRAVDFVLFIVGTCSALSFYIASQRAAARSWFDSIRYVPALMAIGVGIAEGLCKTASLDWFLCNAVELSRRRDAANLVQRRHDVDDVQELTAQAALVLDARRPGDDHRIARAAEVAGDLLRPLEGCVHGVRPRRGKMVEVLRAAELVDRLDIVLPLLREAVEEHVLAE